MIIRSRWRLFRSSLWQTIGTGFLLGVLLVIANLLLIGTWNTQEIRDWVQPKLGMYFYVTQGVDQQIDDQTAVSMIDELKEAGLETTFFSKEQAFQRLTAQVPDVLPDLEKYGVDNPLPATIYVTFRSEEEYQIMKSIVMRYEALISNSNDVSSGVRFTQQEERIQTVMNVLLGVQSLGVFLIISIGVIMVAFIWYSCVINVTSFREQVELEKLLGVPFRRVLMPFVLQIVTMVVVGFVAFLAFGRLLLSLLSPAVEELFGRSVEEFLLSGVSRSTVTGGEFVVLLALALFAGLVVLRRLIVTKE